jgi:hypothetical protein
LHSFSKHLCAQIAPLLPQKPFDQASMLSCSMDRGTERRPNTDRLPYVKPFVTDREWHRGLLLCISQQHIGKRCGQKDYVNRVFVILVKIFS